MKTATLLLLATTLLALPGKAQAFDCTNTQPGIATIFCASPPKIAEPELASIPDEPAEAEEQSIEVKVNIATQVMEVEVNGAHYASWKVSTAKPGFRTPRGSFTAQSQEPMHYSKKYDNAPMPHSVFFHYGYAIHATDAVAKLGKPASHGCIRLAPANAATFYALVEEVGLDNTRITLVD